MIDLHCDTVSRILKNKESLSHNSGHFDLTRALAAGQQMQIAALYSSHQNPDANLRDTLEQIAYFNKEMLICENLAYRILNATDVLRETEKIGMLLHMEGAESLGNSTELLDLFFTLGLRSIGLTWNHRNVFADGVYEHGGLTSKGRELITACQKKGIVVDLAHCSERSSLETLEIARAPVMISHANAWGIYPCFRNVSDQVLAALKSNGGIIGVTYVADFVSAVPMDIDKLVQHILYLIEKIGVECVALGSDFDGADDMVINKVEDTCFLRAELTKYIAEKDIERIFYQNAADFLRAVLPGNII